MKRLATTLFFTFFSFLYILASIGGLKGSIKDAASRSALEFVNISLYDSSGTKLIKGTISDENGLFRFDGLKSGNYLLRISYVGYKTFEKAISISDAKSMQNINVVLKEDSEILGEVQIVGQKSQMRFDIDKRVFNADQSIATIGGSASDLLSNIPSIDVDTEGTISLRGNSSVTVWINGKESGLTSDNQAEILEQLPAETIEKVEIITNPSAKYSPEGTAGIINIVLKEDTKPGYYGSVQAQADIQGGAKVSGNINFTSGKWNGYANIGYRHGRHTRGGYTNRLMNNGENFLNQTTDGLNTRDNGFTRLGVSYRATDKDMISLSGFGMLGGGTSDNTVLYTSNVPGNFTNATRLTDGTNNMKGGNLILSYDRKINPKSELALSASYSVWDRESDTDYKQHSIYDNREENSLQRQQSDGNNSGWEFQADYTNRINDNNKIEVGYKGNLRSNENPLTTYNGTDEINLKLEEELYNKFRYKQNIQALYLSYSGKIENFGMQLGLRGEYSNTNTNSVDYNKNELVYDKSKFDLFPSVFLSYSLPKGNELQVNYTRRIQRPWGGMLNSFKNITDSTNISTGNPDLSPQYSNSFELNYIKNWEKHMFSLSSYYRTTDDVFQRISFLDENNIMNSTWFNVTKSTSAGVELVGKNKLFDFIDLTTTVNLYYYKLNGFEFNMPDTSYKVQGKSEENFAYNAKVIANFMLPKSFSLQLTGGYNSRESIAQGTKEPTYTLDAGIKKSFLNGKLNVVLNARDILDSRHRHTITSGTGFWQESESWRQGRNVRLTLTYSFGNMRAKRESRPDTGDSNMSDEMYDMD